MKSSFVKSVLTVACLVCMTCASASLRVDVEGLPDDIETNVLAYLSIVKVAGRLDDNARPLSEFAVKRLHDKAQQEIAEALMPFGYYAPVITSDLVQNPQEWVARYVIDRGDPTIIRELEIRIDSEVAERIGASAILAKSDVKLEHRLNHAAYAQLKQSILSRALESGYLDAQFSLARLEVEPERSRARVQLHLDAGERFVFGHITLVQDAVDQSFAERYITVEPGAPFATEKLVELQFALTDSGYFQDVTVSAPRSAAEGNVIPVQIRAQSRKAQRYSARLGFGTDTGPRVRLGTEFRRLNSRGSRFRSDLQVSRIRSTFNAQYGIPIKNVATDRQTFSGSFNRAEIGDTDSDLYAIGARRYDRWKGLRRQMYIEFENELFSLGSTEDVRTDLLVVGASLAYQKVDDALFTRKGLSARLDVHGAHKGALSDTTFVQATLATRAIYPLSKRSRLLLRSDIGFTDVDDLSRLPPSQRFFTGGDRTIRGYGFQTLSPENALGEDVGGRYLLSASVEADYFFNDKYGVAAFFDHGNAVNDLSDALKSGAGLGFRYRTPIGVLRIDAARPLDTSEDDFRLHISLGPDS